MIVMERSLIKEIYEHSDFSLVLQLNFTVRVFTQITCI